MKLTNYVVLINTNRYADIIIKQLDLTGAFNNVDVYIAERKKYKNNETIKKVQSALLETLDEFVRICNKHNLKYYLTGGTLLGAVRHKGFIPWDDDIDVDMPKHDFNKFVNLPPQELGEQFSLFWLTRDENYVHIIPPARLKKRNTFRQEWPKGYENIDEEYCSVGICIFRMLLTKKKTFGTFTNYKASFYDRIFLNLHDKLDRTAVKKMGFCLASPKTFFSVFSVQTILRIREFINSLYNCDSGYFCDKPVNEAFAEGIPMEFEEKLYNVPKNWDYCLIKRYGNDYLQLPPLEKRFSHCPRKLSLDVKNDIWEDL